MLSRVFYVTSLVLALTLSGYLQTAYSASDAPINVSKSSGESYRAQILVDGDYVYLVWTDKTPGNADVFFARSLDGGKNFETPINLSNNNGSSAFPRLAVSGANVYVTWYDYSPGQSDIFFARSKDRGASFESVNLSNNTQASYNPWIATSGNNVFVVWNNGGKSQEIVINGEKRIIDVLTGESEILLARSSDGGSTFETINISNTEDMSWNPRIAVAGSDIYVAWNEGVSPLTEIFFAKGSDYGASFSEPVNLSRSNGTSMDAGIAVSNDKIYITWMETSSENSEIFFSKSDDSGMTFSTPINLSDSVGKSNIVRDAEIASYENNAYVVWYDDTSGNYDVFFTRSADYGKTFSPPVNLSQNSGKSELAQISVSGENVYVMWNDYTMENAEIFLRESQDSGETFGSIQNISNDADESLIFILGPQITTTEDKVFTVWEVKAKGNGDLFLKVFDQKAKSEAGLLSLQTTNGAINVEVGIDKKIEEGEISTFTLKFMDPLTDKALEHVNYSFYIEDVTGNKVINSSNQYSETGISIQNATFSKTGPFTMVVEVNGLGINTLDNASYTGTTSAVITVIPEFPYGVIPLFIITMISIMILQKFKLFS